MAVATTPLMNAKNCGKVGNSAIIRRMSMETYMVRIYTGPLSQEHEFVSVEAEKITTSDEVVRVAIGKLGLGNPQNYELAEVFSSGGQLCKERRLEEAENPVRIQLLWPPRVANAERDRSIGLHTGYRFYMRKKNRENVNRTSSWLEYSDPNPVDNFLTAFLNQPTNNKEYSDLCNLPDLNERTLLENIKSRFSNKNIYTYVGSILIAVNPFKFFPIYNPKYVKMYQNKRLGDLPPHIFAIADAAFHTMLRTKKNQCIVISGESGSGKTESTNLLLHHLTALSHKGLHGSGVEQTILGAGPVLEAFGNAKTVHNNNSSRFGKFIQVNYKENGMVHGAIVEKYLLEKSRIVSQAKDERNYHVFYYLLEGADPLEREKLHLGKPEDYFYLKQSDCFSVDEVDEANEFSRLKQSMEMVGFSQVTQKRIFGVLSAVLHLGNVKFKKKGDQHHDESVSILNPETITIITQLLKVKERTLVEALTQKKATAGDETVVMNHRMEDAVATRDAMAKCLYGALFDWIVLKVNQALLAKRHNSEHLEEEEVASVDNTLYVRHTGNSIGVLDIFGFEDFTKNSFEQFCINYANEHLQYYFNQHIFKFEQEEYKKEGIQWKNIEFIDNTGCLELFSKKANGLFSLLDEECNFPAATNDTLLSKFHHHHAREKNVYYEAPQRKEMAFTVVHYAGKVKYTVKDFREKNSDQIRTDIVGNMKSSSLAFVRELMGVDPVAVLRWTIVKTLIKSMFAFINAGKKYRQRGGPDSAVVLKRKQSDYLNIPDLGSSHFIRRSSPSDLTRHARSPRSSMHESRYSRHAMADFVDREEDDVFLRSPRHSGSLRSPVDPYLSEDEAIVMRRATIVMMKNKSFKPKSRPQTMFSDIKTLKAIANRTMYSGGKVNSKQKPPSVSAQFQWSLARLMATLNQANPFFIRCIKSNAEKVACKFDDVLVLRQLRYTGMLATVRIRQSGYNYRLTFEEFTQLYKILLPKGLQSEKQDVSTFLDSMEMNKDNYQIGITKVFLRETEKLNLDQCLHCAIMKRVIAIQRWVKTKVERKNFILLRENTITVQKHIRKFLARRRVVMMFSAIVIIQKWYRGARERRAFSLVRRSAIRIQAHVKGHLCRKQYRHLKKELAEKRLAEEQEALKQEDMHSSTSDEGVLIKDNSADELDLHTLQYQRRDSEESSGILDDSESDTLSEAKSRGDSISSPPQTPTSFVPEINIEGLPGSKGDEYLNQSKQSSRVSNLASIFQPADGQGSSDEPDGRPIPGTIFIRRGSARKRPPSVSPAPLAKQESFSDLDSPTTELRGSPLSPEKRKQIEDSLMKKPGSRLADGLATSADDVSKKSPFMKKIKHMVVHQESLRETKSFPTTSDSYLSKRKMSISSTLIRRTKSSIKLLRDLNLKTSGGRKKKDSTADDSDDDVDVNAQHGAARRPHTLPGGVSVLPHQHGRPHSPKSPNKDDSSSILSGDDNEEKVRRIEKKRRTKKEKGDKDQNKENRPLEVQQKNWTVAKTSQWQYPEDFVITDIVELQLLDEFINRKIVSINKDHSKKESQFDIVFSKCLKSFHAELKTSLSLLVQKTQCNIKYRDLFANFEQIMHATCNLEKVDEDLFPVTMCTNAFRGFLDEFRNTVNSKKKETKYKKKRPKRENKKKDLIEYQGHKFSQVQFGIPTFCELCSNIIWIMEKGHVCQVCKYTCHRKCIYKSSSPCKGAQDSSSPHSFWSARSSHSGIPIGPSVNDVIHQLNNMTQCISGTKVFGVRLQNLVGKNLKIPTFMDNLICLIETHGLFTVGIYRKSGLAHKIKVLKVALDSGVKDISIEEYTIHVLTSTLKCFFRELPEPLLTFELYDEFIQAAEIHDEKEAIQVLFSLIERLPKVNHDVFERLIFHLARVANHENSNKMSVNGLAIIFAPCLLRTNKVIQAQEMITQVSRQQQCIEKILQEQLVKLKTRLQDINTLESAEATANERLTVVRASMRNTKKDTSKKVEAPASVSEDPESLEEQERVINSHIESLRKEKDDLTSSLPVFEYRLSSDDEMLSVDDMESTYDTADEMEYGQEETASNFDLPAKPPSQLSHLTKYRANVRSKRPPSQFKQYSTDSEDEVKLCQSELTSDNSDMQDHHDNRDGHSSATVAMENSSGAVGSGHEGDVQTTISGDKRNRMEYIDIVETVTSSSSHFDRKSQEYFVSHTGPLHVRSSTLSRKLQTEETRKTLTLTQPLPFSPGSRSNSRERLKPKIHTSGLTKSKISKSQLGAGDQVIRTKAGRYVAQVSDAYLKPKEKGPLLRQYSDTTLQTSTQNITPGSSPRSDNGVLDSSSWSPSTGLGSSPQSRPLALVQRSSEWERISSYDNSSFSVMKVGDESDDEIMV